MIWNYIIGALFVGAGIVIVWRQKNIFDLFGEMAFAQRYFGSTYTFITIVGVIVIFFGFAFIAGCLDSSSVNTVPTVTR